MTMQNLWVRKNVEFIAARIASDCDCDWIVPGRTGQTATRRRNDETMVYVITRTPADDACALACGVPVNCAFRDDDDDSSNDFIDEVVDNLRANVLYRRFPVSTPRERLTVYLTSFASDLLYLCATDPGMETATTASQKAASVAARDDFDGGRGTTTNAQCTSAEERETFRRFARRCRETLARRLVARCYARETGQRDKFWTAFARRRFLNRAPPVAF